MPRTITAQPRGETPAASSVSVGLRWTTGACTTGCAAGWTTCCTGACTGCVTGPPTAGGTTAGGTAALATTYCRLASMCGRPAALRPGTAIAHADCTLLLSNGVSAMPSFGVPELQASTIG